MHITDYIADMKVHINRYCTEIPRIQLNSIHKDTKASMEEINHLISDGKQQFLDSCTRPLGLPQVDMQG
jgi:hypothetical protein